MQLVPTLVFCRSIDVIPNTGRGRIVIDFIIRERDIMSLLLCFLVYLSLCHLFCTITIIMDLPTE